MMLAGLDSVIMGPTVFTVAILSCVLFLTLPSYIDAFEKNNNFHQRDGIHAPCTFFDTVNITGDVRLPNGSFVHNGVVLPNHLVGLYDYVYKDLVDRVEVAPHWRGCVCKLRPCVNFCCPWGTIYNSNLSTCENTSVDHQWPEPLLNVTLNNGSLVSVNIFEQFMVQHFRPCMQMFSLQPQVNYYDAWELYENGTMLRVDDMKSLNKNEFCLVPTLTNESDIYYTINPANCDPQSAQGTVKIINAYAMLFSIPFMVLTIAVYLLVPELCNQHGKSLVCYLIGLAVGYSSLSIVLLSKLSPDGVSCKVIGYTAYYFFMSAFFWLSVISFDLWHNFRGTRGVNRFQEKKRFIFYSLYAWGLAFIFLIFTFCAQEYAPIPDILKPGIGDGFYCWIDMHNWSAMIYFFAPIIIIIVSNTVMYVMTAFKIHTVQREMARIIAREDSTRNLRSEKDKFGLFLRLFLIMGVTWSMEIISYFVGTDKEVSKFFYITDICNAMQGFLIFMLFVMKKKVKHLITNRYLCSLSSNNQRQSQYSTKTTMSSVANLSMQDRSPAEKPLVTVAVQDLHATTHFG